MRINMIPIKDIKRKHPKGLDCATDREYALIGGEILQALVDCKIQDIDMDGLKAIALNFTMYFEDVVADAGIWRAFTNKMKEMYGTYLPFFNIDEANYYRDEPNLEDLQLLMWYTMFEVHVRKIANPENPIIKRMAQKALDIMEKHFETVAMNEELKAYFVEAPFMEDYFEQRDVLKWLNFGCYLTYDPFVIDILMESTETLTNVGFPEKEAYYMAECLVPYKFKIGPLNIMSQEWLSAILKENGNYKAAKIVGEQRFKDLYAYKIVSSVPGVSMTFTDPNGETFTVTAENLNDLPIDCYNNKCVAAAFVCFNEKWYLMGSCLFNDNEEQYNESVEDYKSDIKKKEMFAKLIEKNGGSPLFYFAKTKDLKEFIKKNIDLELENDIMSEFGRGKKDWILCIPTDGGDPGIYPHGARCVKADNNPYYDKKYAADKALSMIITLPEDIQTYMIENNLVPDATINSIYGQERGNYIVQHNFDFIIRAINSRI